jgi:predicted PurR-regulated permease PerM
MTTEQSIHLWSNRRILSLLAIGTLIVSVIWHAPQEAHYIGQRTGELFFALVLAMSLTYLLRPGMRALHRLRLFGAGSRSGRMWATIVIFLIAGGLVYLFAAVSLRQMTKELRVLRDDFVALDATERKSLMNRWQTRLNTAIAPYRSFLPPGAEVNIEEAIPDAIASFTPRARAWAGGLFSHLGFIVELLLVPVLAFYFLSDGAAIRGEAELLLPAAWRPRAARMTEHLDRILDGYIRGQVFMCLIAWGVVTVGLWLLGVPHAATMGLVAGLTRAVPVVGPLLGGIPIALMCMVATGSLEKTGAVLLGFTVMHFVESKVLLPKIIGHQVDLHPVSVIVALLLGLEFFGFLGVFLAVPVAALFKIVLTEWHAARLLEDTQMEATQRTDDAGEIPPETPSAAVREAGSDAEAQHLAAALGDTQTTGKEQIAHVPHSRQHAPDK